MARARLAREGERARTFALELTAGPPPSGSVTVMDGLRSEGTRRLDADTCEDVADALALMVALALDPHAQRAQDPAAPSERAPSPDAGPAPSSSADFPPDSSAPDSLSPDSSAPDSTAPDSPSSPPPVTLPPSPDAEPTRIAAGASPARVRHFFAGVDLALATDVTPRVLLAGAPYVGWRSTRAAILGPSFRAAFLRSGTGTLAATGASADFTWTVGRLDACAMLWPARPLRVGGCVRAEGGVLDVAGERIEAAQTQHSAWFAAGALARLEWSFLGPLLLDVGAGPAFHITAKQFVFLPDHTQVYEVPVVGFVAEAGIGVHFL